MDLIGHLVQTDMMDLLGSDLPVESDEGMKFAWSDGILLQVIQLLDLKLFYFYYTWKYTISLCLCRL